MEKKKTTKKTNNQTNNQTINQTINQTNSSNLTILLFNSDKPTLGKSLISKALFIALIILL